jgi:hypothetical protein
MTIYECCQTPNFVKVSDRDLKWIAVQYDKVGQISVRQPAQPIRLPKNPGGPEREKVNRLVQRDGL